MREWVMPALAASMLVALLLTGYRQTTETSGAFTKVPLVDNI